MESTLFEPQLLERLIFFNQRSYQYLEFPTSFTELFESTIPKVIVVTCGSDSWVFKVRLNKKTNTMQFYGNTVCKFLESKDVRVGHILQLVIGENKVYLTDFNQFGLSKQYYYNDSVRGCRPRCLVYATQDSKYHQVIPIDFWNKVKFNVQRSVTLLVDDNDYEVDLWLDDKGLIKGFVGDNWSYADTMMFEGCLLIFQQLIDIDLFELKVYDPNGELYGPEYVDHEDVINHPHILFDNQLAVLDDDYKNIKSFDLDAKNVITIDTTASNAQPHNTDKKYSFKKKITKTVLSKRALHIPASFVRDHHLYDYAKANITFRSTTKTMTVKLYGDSRQSPEKQASNAVFQGDWKRFIKETNLKNNSELVFYLQDATSLGNGKVYFTVLLLDEVRFYVSYTKGFGGFLKSTVFYC